jgi:hypothetical protein
MGGRKEEEGGRKRRERRRERRRSNLQDLVRAKNRQGNFEDGRR